MAVAQAGNIELIQETNPDLPAMKESGVLPFGQLPYLVHGNVKIAQSGAIIRYFAKLSNLDGKTMQEFGVSDMLIEEYQDIFAALSRCNYHTDKAAAYNAAFAEGGVLNKQFAFLENLLVNEYFASDQPLAGDYCIVAGLDLCISLDPDCLNSFPKLKNLYDKLITTAAFNDIRNYPMFLSKS